MEKMIEQLQSKKFKALILALSAVMGTSAAEQPWYVTVMVGAVAAVYILAQGIADQGKEAAKVAQESTERLQGR